MLGNSQVNKAKESVESHKHEHHEKTGLKKEKRN